VIPSQIKILKIAQRSYGRRQFLKVVPAKVQFLKADQITYGSRKVAEPIECQI
jgi:hypothetical protein